MNEVNQNRPATIRGVLTDIRSVPTQTGTAFVVCKIDRHKCKLFGEVAKLTFANQDQYEGQQTEARGHWDVQRGNEFVIDGFGTQPIEPTTAVRRQPISDTRPEKPAMEVKDNYVVITIPRGVTPEQLDRVVGVAKEAVRGLETQLRPGLSELANVLVTTSDPSEETGDIEF